MNRIDLFGTRLSAMRWQTIIKHPSALCKEAIDFLVFLAYLVDQLGQTTVLQITPLPLLECLIQWSNVLCIQAGQHILLRLV